MRFDRRLFKFDTQNQVPDILFLQKYDVFIDLYTRVILDLYYLQQVLGPKTASKNKQSRGLLFNIPYSREF